VSITTCTLTVKVNTNKHEYLQTTSATTIINPGGTIAITASIPYLEADEQVKADGIALYDAFFD
jgi:hypothetical protein